MFLARSAACSGGPFVFDPVRKLGKDGERTTEENGGHFGEPGSNVSIIKFISEVEV